MIIVLIHMTINLLDCQHILPIGISIKHYNYYKKKRNPLESMFF